MTSVKPLEANDWPSEYEVQLQDLEQAGTGRFNLPESFELPRGPGEHPCA
jgi:hypothetical protein